MRILVIAALAALGSQAAFAAPPPNTPAAVAVFKEKGAYVMRDGGASLPLYTYDLDKPGKSACQSECSKAWPPLTAQPDAAPVGDWATVKRDDGVTQWAWRGRPVYTHGNDAPEKPTGNGTGGIWRLLPTIPAN